MPTLKCEMYTQCFDSQTMFNPCYNEYIWLLGYVMEPMDIVGKSKEDASLPKGNYAPLWSDALATVELLATICLYLCNTMATPRYASKTISV